MENELMRFAQPNVSALVLVNVCCVYLHLDQKLSLQPLRHVDVHMTCAMERRRRGHGGIRQFGADVELMVEFVGPQRVIDDSTLEQLISIF